jgi:hypothetical protein
MPRNEDPPTHHGLTANRVVAIRAAPFLIAALVASCAHSSAPIGAAYSQELAGRIAGAPRSCITAVSNANLNAIDSSTLVYHSGDTIYVNHLSSPCSAIAPLNTLIVDAQQGHYCRGDRVRGLEPGAIIAGPVCILGDWVPYRKP